MKKLILYFCILPCVWFACTEDKGTYDYREVNELTIDTISDVSVEAYQLVNIPAKVHSSQENGGFEYLWYRYTGDELEVDTISMESTLDWKVNLAVGEYTIYLKVTDSGTGLSEKAKFKLKVIGKFDEGLMVLSEIDGQIDMCFINEAGNVVSVYDPQNSSSLGKHPVCIANTKIPNGGELNHILLFCDDSEGGKILSGSDFSTENNFSDLFFIAPDQIKPQAYYRALSYGQLGLADYIIGNGKLHTRFTSENNRGAKLFNPLVSGDYELSPYAIVNGAASLFYDNKNGRFLVMKIGTFRVNKTFSLLGSNSENFDPADMKLKLVYMAEGCNKTGYGIFRNSQDQLEKLVFSLNYYSDAYSDYPMKLISREPIPANVEGVGNSPGYAMSLAKPFLYYSKGSKVFLYDLNGNNSFPVYDVDTIPGLNNSTVDKVYIEYFPYFSQYGNPGGLYNKVLYVSSSTPTGEKNGSIHVLKLSDNGTIEERTALYKNVCGKTVSMCYKR